MVSVSIELWRSWWLKRLYNCGYADLIVTVTLMYLEPTFSALPLNKEPLRNNGRLTSVVLQQINVVSCSSSVSQLSGVN